MKTSTGWLSRKRRREAAYQRGYQAGLSAAKASCEPIAYLRHGEETFVQNVPFGAMWISDKDDPRAFPVYDRPQEPAPSVAVKADEVDAIIEELLDAQQDISLAANSTMDQSLCDASALIDRVEILLNRVKASALSAQVQDVAGSGGMEFPEALTDDLRDVLSTMLWTSGQIAACLRAGGDQIKTRAEDEQAHVLHWLISLALKHGPEWRAKASERIKAIGDAAAPAKQEGGSDGR